MTPSEIPLQETLRFLERTLPSAPQRILEVGAGNGVLAVVLAEFGHEVTALDVSLERPGGSAAERVRWTEADFLYHEDPARYDVVLFTRSLHHLTPLDLALDRARDALDPGGLLIAEEFAFDRVNLPTARWFYDLESILAAAGLLEESSREEDGNPLGRWRAEHAYEPPLHSGHAMLGAVRERFELSVVEEAPYLYRSFCASLESSDRGVRVAKRILDLERRMLRERDLAAAGLRMVGKKLD